MVLVKYYIQFLCLGRVAYSDRTVRLSVCLSVCPSEILSHLHLVLEKWSLPCNIDHSNLIFVMHVYLMELHILSCERSRSSFKVILHGQRSNICGQNRSFYEYFCNIEDSNLIFGMHVYLMELHILSGERLRSRSSFKVRVQIYVAQIAYFMNTFAILKIAT